MKSLRRIALEAFLPIVLMAVWWVASAGSTSVYFPPLSKILQTFGDVWFSSTFTTDALPSIERLLIGYVLAALIGIAVGVALGVSGWARRATSPMVEFLRSIPAPLLVPIAIIILGVGTAMKVWVIVLGAVWPVLLGTIAGVRSVDETKREMVRSYQVPRAQTIRSVVLPAASPQIMSGLRTALSIAIIMMVISEMEASTNGIGYYVLEAQRTFAIPQMWAGILLLGLLGYAANLLFMLIERWVLRWHRNVQGAAT